MAPGRIIHRRVFAVFSRWCDFAVFSELAACMTVLTRFIYQVTVSSTLSGTFSVHRTCFVIFNKMPKLAKNLERFAQKALVPI